MKTRIFTLSLFWVCAAGWSQGVLLSPGESCTFQFSSLSYLRAALPAENYIGGLAVDFPNNGFIGGETVQVDRFRDTIADSPISSVITLPTPSDLNGSTAILSSWPNDQPFWTDMQGSVRVTGVNGSVHLQGIIVNELINGGVYGAYLAVPEPSTLSFLLLCADFLAARGLRRNHSTNSSLASTATDHSVCGGVAALVAPRLRQRSVSGGCGSVWR